MSDLPIEGFATTNENSAMVLLVDDQAMIGEAVRRGLWVRMGHALGFEGGFILIGLPLAAWMLDITLWQALMVFLAGVFVINWQPGPDT